MKPATIEPDPHTERPLPPIERIARRLRTSVVHEVLPLMADPWNPHLMLTLWMGLNRFEQLVEALNISRGPLALRLQWLQDAQCVWREGEGHASYRLTPRGADLLGVVVLNRQWNDHWGQPQRVHPNLVLHHDCGARLDARVLCGHCHEEVLPRDVKTLEWPGEAVQGPLPPLPPYRRARRHSAPGNSTGALPAEDLSGDRWMALILAAAFMGLRRNSEFERAIGIAPNVLADRLSTLVQHGLFSRVPYQTNPERHEYRLTRKGLDRHTIVLAMMAWAQRWAPRASEASHWHVLHTTCHEWLTPAIVCASCGGAVSADRLRVA